MKAVGMLGVAMEEAWREARPIGDVIGLVSSLMVHPDHLTQSSPVWPIRELIADWALNNHAVVARLATRSWVEEASKSKEAQEFRERAAELTKAWDKAAAEAQRARELGLESYARKRALDLGDFLRKAVSDAQSRAVTALVDLHALTQQKKSELTQRNLESALAELHAQFDRQTSALQQQSYASFQQFQRLAEQRYATLTSEKVQAAYREQARLDAEHALQELHAWTDDKLNELQADSKKQRGRLDDYLVSADPIDVVRSKLERIKAAIEASGQSAVDSAKRADKDLRQLVRDIEQELEAPPPESELSALLEREAARLEEKLRAAAEAARGAEDPATKLERETFVKKQLARFRLLLERILDDAQSAPESKQVGQAAGQELDRIREEATKQTHEVARRGPELAGQLKQEVHELTEERQVDAQLDYIAQLKPKTRGIEEGSRK